MYLRIDNYTGCHYLAIPAGGITPRLNPNGQHFGCKTNKETNDQI